MRQQIPDSLRALGREPLPATISVATGHYRFIRTFKHDFFAVTALYEGPAGRAVLKIGRKADFLGIPCGWIGRWLASHEAEAYRRLQDLDSVPRYLDMWGRHGFVHEYVEGHQMAKGERVPDDFFAHLRQSIDTIHQRHMAYVDLEKPQNVIVGDDGQPYLIDFQVSWYSRRAGRRGWWLNRVILNRLQRADRYHLGKLQRRTRPDQLTPEQLAATYRRPWYIHAHRWLTSPLMRIRRRTLERLDPRRRPGGERGAMP